MHLNTQQLNKLCTIAITAAKEAGELISTYRDVKTEVKFKKDKTTDPTVAIGAHSLAAQVVTEVDLKSQEIILKHLVPTLEPYDLGLLTEETVDDCSRFEKKYFWCVDPLDGTLPFIKGKPGYAVSIALVSSEGKALIGVVLDPVRQNLYHAIEKQGAFKNNEKIMTNKCSDVFSFITDGSFIEYPRFERIKQALKEYCSLIGCESLEQIDYGGAVMNAIWVMENNPACYFKLPKLKMGGGSLWDFAATTCIFRELGLSVSDFKGKQLKLNKDEGTFMNQDGIIYASNSNISEFLQNFKR